MNQEFLDKQALRVQELIEGVDAGDFADPDYISEKYTYGHMYSLFLYRNSLDGAKDLYRDLYRLATQYAERCVRATFRKKGKVRVAIEAITASQWACADIYRLLRGDPRFEVYVVLVPNTTMEPAERARRVSMSTSYFLSKGYDVRSGLDPETGKPLSFDEWGGYPDIVIHCTPWFEGFPDKLSIESFPLSVLNIGINYTVDVANSPDNRYLETFMFNKELYNMVWRCYAADRYEMEGYRTYQFLKGENVRFSGYSKLDRMYEKKDFTEMELRQIWKIPERMDPVSCRKVIFAPHFTMRNFGAIHLSTFHQNLYFFLYLADKYKDQICFAYKPHPNVREATVSSGLFKSMEEYDAYLEEWNRRDNCKVVEEAEYLDLFQSSDGLIMDSASFMAEYLYAHKPVLYLRRPDQAFNGLGNRILETFYQVQGWDYTGIDRFLEEVILGKNDPKRPEREAVFAEELDYLHINGEPASDYIYRDIESLLEQS